MKILYISYMHPEIAPGGAQQVAFELYKSSLELGHDAYLLAALETSHEESYGKPGAPIAPMHGESRQFFLFPQNYDYVHLSIGDWRTIKFLREFIENIDPEIIHFHHYHRIGVESIRAARLAAPNATITLTFHEMLAICMADGQMVRRNTRDLCRAAVPMHCNQCFPELRPEFFTLRAERLKACLDECDSYIFPSIFLANRYIEWGLAIDKCAVIENGQANLARNFDRKQHSRLVNRFGFFGQFIDNKGVDVLLEAVAILSREKRLPACGLIIEINGANKHYATTGYIERVESIFQQLRDLKEGPLIINQKGKYGRDQLAERMADVDWVVVPSTWWEVFGLVVSEAWMFGRPVVCADIAGLGERVRNGENGFKFPVRDARALANLMLDLVNKEVDWLKLNESIMLPDTDIEMFQAYEALWKECRKNAERVRSEMHINTKLITKAINAKLTNKTKKQL